MRCDVQLQRISDVLTIYSRPLCQRALNVEHVDKLVSDIQHDLATTGENFIRQSITVARLPNGASYVLDGQHRLAAFTRLRHESRVMKSTIPVVYQTCVDLPEVQLRYHRLNSNLPIHPLDTECDWAWKTRPLLEYIQDHYRMYIKESKSPICPHFSISGVQTALRLRADQLLNPVITQETLLSDFQALNEFIRETFITGEGSGGGGGGGDSTERLQKCYSKQPHDPCFISLGRHHEWLDMLIFKRLNNFDWTVPGSLILETFEQDSQRGRAHPRRKPIPRALRLRVWTKCNSPDARRGSCYVCGGVIDYDTFECAHDIPHILNGSTDISNLYPTCRPCNRDMGVQPLHLYRKRVRDQLASVEDDDADDDGDVVMEPSST